MSPPARPISDVTEIHVCDLQSALRRRGVGERNGELPGSVVAEHQGRRIVVRLIAGRWYRPVSGDSSVLVPVCRAGSEDVLARHLVRELLGLLP